MFPERPALDPLPEGTASVLNAKKVAHSVAMLVSVVVACGLVFWLWQTQIGTTSAETNKPEVPPPAIQPIPAEPKPATEAATPALETQTPAPPKEAAPRATTPVATVEKPPRVEKLKRGPGSAVRSKRKAKPRTTAQTGD